MSVYKTESFRNIDTEAFTGRFAGEDILIEAGESTMLTPYVVRHIARQLADKLMLRRCDEYLARAKTKEERLKEPSYKDELQQAELISKMRDVPVKRVLDEFMWERQGMSPELKEKLDARKNENVSVDTSQVDLMIQKALEKVKAETRLETEEFAGVKELKKELRK